MSLLIKFILLIIIYFIRFSQDYINELFVENKPYLWLYWENINNSSTPDYILLCMATIVKHCKNDFNIVILNEQTVNKYITLRDDLYKLRIQQKVDYIRIQLLKQYGGMYLDADTIVFKTLIDFYNKSKYKSFICYARSDNYTPRNGVLASRKNGSFVKQMLDIMNIILDNAKVTNNYKFDYFEFGANLMYKIRKTNDDIYYYDQKTTGEYVNGSWQRPSDLILNKNLPVFNDNVILYSLNNSTISKMIEFRNKTKQELLLDDSLYAKLIKYSLNI